MATTIITKHGTGVPSSLEVGELAIDKAEPAIYTNTGTGVEKIATASSGGGGGGGTQYPISDAVNPGTLITITGNQASNFVYDYNTTDFALKVANGGQLSPTDMITMTLPSTHMFHIVPTADKNDIGTTDPGVGAKLGGYFVAFSNPPIKMTLHEVNGESGSNRNLVSNMSAQGSFYVSFKGADAIHGLQVGTASNFQ